MFLIIATPFVAAYLFHLLYWRRRNLPPGPLPLPILGNLSLMKHELRPGYGLWKNLSIEYGPIYTFWMAHLPIVMVTDWNLIKQAFIKDGASYAGRPIIPWSIEMRNGIYGIIEAVGERWQQQRRFALHVLRDFGMGKNLMEEKVINELRALIDTVKKEQTKHGNIDMQNFFDASVGSIINSLLFGYRYDETNMEMFLALKSKLSIHMKTVASPACGIISMYPWIGNFPYFCNFKKAVGDNWKGLKKVFREQTEKKLETIDYDSEEYSDYVEAFLKERKKHEHEPNYGGYELDQLDSVCFDLWVAGMETTSNTLYWALLYVLVNDDVRKKIYQELDEKIESDRIITSADKHDLNYISATINEVQRLANLLPANLSRSTTKEVEIAGYKIPEGIVINAQISQVMYNEEIFPEPYKFKPGRFLDSEGKLMKVEEFVPFSIGKRQCLGEGLARLELFIFFANIFNHFDISLDQSNPTPSLEKDYGMTMKARNFKVVMKNRF